MLSVTLTLLDWRRRVASMFADVRSGASNDPVDTLARFRAAKDELFATHPDSPLPDDRRTTFAGLSYWPYDAGLRFDVEVQTIDSDPMIAAPSSGGDEFPLRRIGQVELPMGSLDVFWIDVYGGGVFVPCRDTTAGHESYGGGRYLLDTVKGADLGGADGRLILDFNYAYNPSCSYDPRWLCPLAPNGSWLDVRIEAGERH